MRSEFALCLYRILDALPGRLPELREFLGSQEVRGMDIQHGEVSEMREGDPCVRSVDQSCPKLGNQP